MDKSIWDYQGIWILVGILVGSVINIIVFRTLTWLNDRTLKNNFTTELKMNLKTIKGFLEELERYRDAVNSETLNEYYGYFRFNKIIHPIANELYFKGHIYKWLKDEQIINMNEAYTFFSIEMESIIYKQMAEFRQIQASKQEATRHVRLLESQFKDHLKNLTEVLEQLH